MDWVKIGSRIRRQRERLGYTREELAEKLDITPKFCYDIELGAKGMSVQTLCLISKELGLSTDFILFGSDDEELKSPTITMLRRCPPEKMPFLEDIIRSFVRSIDKE
ncbi:MAG: helix-turn-helix transcriptional regulator [Clostridia bacterium]|nr:helix-turn-helix transcriptional regulator [Clostridia bacterium]